MPMTWPSDAVWTGGARWNRVSLYTSNEQQEGFGTEFVLVNTGPGEDGFTFVKSAGHRCIQSTLKRCQAVMPG